MAISSSEPVPMELYFDYICPFCYIGSERLDRLVEHYPVAVHYRPIEIHPENPAEGMPLESLGYPPEHWQRMMSALQAMIDEDELPFAERTFTTNSRRALLLAQSVLDQRPQAFRALHRDLFRAYFVNGHNIGDERVLWGIAEFHGVSDLLETAWNTPAPMERLLEHVEAAQMLGLSGVPTLVVGGRAFAGAVSMQTLESALREQGVATGE